VGRQTSILVRTDEPVSDPAWIVDKVDIEDLVLAYMRQADPARGPQASGTGSDTLTAST
jgi:ABC-2 type transport system ATP-binding protein